MSDAERALTGPLSRGEWNALLFQISNRVRKLAYRLAFFHGAVQPPSDRRCPCCGREPETAPEPRELFESGTCRRRKH